MLPGANLFVSQVDLSGARYPGGDQAIHCKSIGEMKGASTASKGWNYLRRVLAGLDEL